MQKFVTKRNVLTACVVGLAALVGLCYEFGGNLIGHSVETPMQAIASKGSGVEKETEVTIQGGYTKPEWKRVLLNTNSDYKASDNLTIVVAKGLGFDDPADVKGKTLVVKGQVVDYKGKPEIVVSSKDQIRVK